MFSREKAKDLSKKGLSFLEQSNVDEGFHLMEQAFRASPKDPCISNNMAMAYQQKGDYLSALSLYYLSLENFFKNPTNICKHSKTPQQIQINIDSAIKLIECDVADLLRSARPARAGNFFERADSDPVKKAVVFLGKVLEFVLNKLSLRRLFIDALEMDGQVSRAFGSAKRLVLELLDSKPDYHYLEMALRVYTLSPSNLVFVTEENLLLDFLSAEKPNNIGLARLKKILQILSPLVSK